MAKTFTDQAHSPTNVNETESSPLFQETFADQIRQAAYKKGLEESNSQAGQLVTGLPELVLHGAISNPLNFQPPAPQAAEKEAPVVRTTAGNFVLAAAVDAPPVVNKPVAQEADKPKPVKQTIMRAEPAKAVAAKTEPAAKAEVAAKAEPAKADPGKEVAKAEPEKKKYVPDEITTSGVTQSGYGDCFFVAALASLANSDKGRAYIRDMVKQNPDGSYVVTFPGDKGNPVTVTAADMKLANTQDKANWANIIETAFLKYDHAGDFGKDMINGWQRQNMPYLGKVFGGAKSLELLTGESAAADQLALVRYDNREVTLGLTSKANVESDLQTSLKNGEPVTASANSSFMKYLGDNSSGPMVGDHVYSVLSYDPKTQTVVVRNPWGNNNGTPFETPGSVKDGITSLPDGKLSMSLDTFMERFSTVQMAGKNPYVNDLANVGNDVVNVAKDYAHAGKAVVSGDLRGAAHHVKNAIIDTVKTDAEIVYSGMDMAERGVKSVAGAAVDVAEAGVNGTVSAAKWLWSKLP